MNRGLEPKTRTKTWNEPKNEWFRKPGTFFFGGGGVMRKKNLRLYFMRRFLKTWMFLGPSFSGAKKYPPKNVTLKMLSHNLRHPTPSGGFAHL